MGSNLRSTPLELAQKYMDIVFTSTDFDQLREILAPKMVFQGPLYNFVTAEDYIESLFKNPPEKFNYSMIKSYMDATSACLIYRFAKPGISTVMVQYFEVENGKISRIMLTFDTANFL
ncbi:MAG: nuclear transport factor 2 family protein [Calditrichaeota bacterium]|nr:MAG: nuclear transport factor 2 family protein [Calditrichota bacterium]